MKNLNDYKMIKIKDFTDKYSVNLWNKVKKYNDGGLNASTSDCYTFIIDKPNWNDWKGGFDWKNNIVDPLEYLYNFKNKKLYQLK